MEKTTKASEALWGQIMEDLRTRGQADGYAIDFISELRLLEDTAKQENLATDQYQSNHEGCLVDKIQDAYGKFDGIVINPAAYTHTSIAILDAVKAVGIPTVEVHISDVSKREDFRQISYIRAACIATISGHGIQGYLEAIDLLIAHHEEKK